MPIKALWICLMYEEGIGTEQVSVAFRRVANAMTLHRLSGLQ
jgi:hypothetical protein